MQYISNCCWTVCIDFILEFLKSSIAANAGLRDIHGANLVFRKLREVWSCYVN